MSFNRNLSALGLLLGLLLVAAAAPMTAYAR